ncbi:hypothetical protein SPI_02747 [Niveomyces insectorum RCEF 264]|uniref:Uncharacterized protein n=1 Tax=Niveomyces insectorum RCEF 264 TaxID=1081102 RepID=A0A162MRX3_9HYPO|nr:hypothetical protein SPI_02747 [Niveomyces insectorum RCEF 264]
MSRLSIRNVLRTTSNALGSDAATTASSTPALVSTIGCIDSIGGRDRRARRSSSGSKGSEDAEDVQDNISGGRIKSTVTRVAHAINFTPSSSPELDATLESIRNKIFLPSYLRAEQRKQLFSPRYEQKLRANPLTLEIDGVVLRFTHMDRAHDIPRARAATRDAVGRMTTRADFENLPRLLEGLHRANRSLRPADYARIARRAGERGCIFTVIESARTVRRTGFRLDNSETVAEILTHVQLKAVDSGWDEAESRQALVWAELVIDLLEDESHSRRPPSQPRLAHSTAASTTSTATAASDVADPPTETETTTAVASSSSAAVPPPPPPAPAFPLARDPQVLAARLHLAAVVADKFNEGGRDDATDRKVARYAADLLPLWPADTGLRALHPAATYTDRRGEMHYLNEDNKFLGVAAPLLHGLDTTIRVLGKSSGSDGAPDPAALAIELQSRRNALGAEVEAALTAAPDRRGAAIYKKFFGES